MILAHGTSARHLDEVLRHGIKPRMDNTSTWDCASNPRMVYLTQSYALYYAMHAAEDNEDALLIEVNVPVTRLYADEDVMAQGVRSGPFFDAHPDLIERTQAFIPVIEEAPPGERKHWAMKSLEHMGTAAHKGVIAPSKITRLAVVPHQDFGRIIMEDFDPMISILNYRFIGPRYVEFQKSLFDKYAYKATVNS